MLLYFSEDFDSRMNVDGACDGSSDSEEDAASVKEEPIEEGDEIVIKQELETNGMSDLLPYF